MTVEPSRRDELLELADELDDEATNLAGNAFDCQNCGISSNLAMKAAAALRDLIYLDEPKEPPVPTSDDVLVAREAVAQMLEVDGGHTTDYVAKIRSGEYDNASSIAFWLDGFRYTRPDTPPVVAVEQTAFRHPRNTEADTKDGWVQFVDPSPKEELTGYAIRKRLENPTPTPDPFVEAAEEVAQKHWSVEHRYRPEALMPMLLDAIRRGADLGAEREKKL